MPTTRSAAAPGTRHERPAASDRSVPRPASLLRVEGALVLAVAVFLYAQVGAGWWLFAALLLVPDVGLLGYLRDVRLGSFTYNVTHTLAVPLALGAGGLLLDADLVIAVALTWVAHIGMDRAVGYGLKYPTELRDTHLQRVA